MIYDGLGAIGLYRGLSRGLDVLIDWLGQNDPADLPLGITQIDGNRVYANVMNASTKYEKDARFETHRKYMDVQIDLEGAEGVYPHATTNSGATNPRFIARNAIDGTWQSIHHGRWPYESWGINGRDDAWLQVDFGRSVHAEEAMLVLRADFPHDTWWQQAKLTCSDGFGLTVHLEKTGVPQRFSLGEGGRDIEWIRLSDMVKADDPAEFPALTQLIVMGTLG